MHQLNPLTDCENQRTESKHIEGSSPVRHLYLHFPFCAKICPYCSFYVQVGPLSRQRETLAAMRMELSRVVEEFPLDLQTIFFGGGTPSLLPPDLFAELAAELPPLPVDGEFTLEVNPATVTPAKARAWRAAGVNRISLGAQSFTPELLQLLGRQHLPEEIPDTCQLLRESGFENLNLDLIFSLPGQSLAQWEQSLRAALACAPQHISAYALTYEEDTPFFLRLQQGVYQADEAQEIAQFELTRSVLREGGLAEYEISNFARPGFASRHNRAYWLGADYLGIGPSAVSTVTLATGTKRWKNIADTAAYVAALARGDFDALRTEEENIDAATRRRERILFGLRLIEGLPLADIADHPDHAASLAALKKLEFLESDADSVRLTPRGRLVADRIALELI